MTLTFMLTFFVNVEVGRSPTYIILSSHAPSRLASSRLSPSAWSSASSRAPACECALPTSQALLSQADRPPSQVSILGRVPGTQYYEPLDDDEDDGFFPSEEIPGVLIVRLRDSSLTFGESLSFSITDKSDERTS